MNSCCVCLEKLNAKNNKIRTAFRCDGHTTGGLCGSCLNKMLTRNHAAKCPMCRAPAVVAINRIALHNDIRLLQRYNTEILFRLVRLFGPIVNQEPLPREMALSLTRIYRQLVALEERTNTRNVVQAIKPIVTELSAYDAQLSEMEATLTPVLKNARSASRFMSQQYANIPFTMSRVPKNAIERISSKNYLMSS